MSKLLNWFKKDKSKQENVDSKSSSPGSEKAHEHSDKNEQQEQNELSAESAKPGQKEQYDAKATPKEDAFSNQKDADDNDTYLPEDFSALEPQAELEPEVVLEQKAEDLSQAKLAPQAEPEQQAEPATQIEPASSDTPATEPNLFARLKASLARTKNNIGSGFTSLLMGKAIDSDLYEELETHLLLADVGMNTTNKIISELTKKAKSSQLKDGAALSAMLQAQMQVILDKVNKPLDFSLATDDNGNKHPFVILMVGVNGVGKTTTIGKLAKQFQAQGKSVMLAAGDTFRAAAVEQLQVWGERNNIAVVAQQTGADSASVIYDAIESAKAKRMDVLIADTAGRLQNKDHLIEELKKVVRVMKKLDPNAPHEIMLTLDASTGQNALSQTKIFNQAVGITGINLTKLDGTAKGGVIFALADEFAIPVRYIGIGEGIDDLRTFESKSFVDALFSQ